MSINLTVTFCRISDDINVVEDNFGQGYKKRCVRIIEQLQFKNDSHFLSLYF